jgi:hypothetical protein
MTCARSWLESDDLAHLFLAMWCYVNAMERERLTCAVEVPSGL